MTRLLNLFRRRRDRLERDLDRELRYHMNRRVEDLIKDGLCEPEARRRASLELGGVPQVQEAVPGLLATPVGRTRANRLRR